MPRIFASGSQKLMFVFDHLGSHMKSVEFASGSSLSSHMRLIDFAFASLESEIWIVFASIECEENINVI